MVFAGFLFFVAINWHQSLGSRHCDGDFASYHGSQNGFAGEEAGQCAPFVDGEEPNVREVSSSKEP